MSLWLFVEQNDFKNIRKNIKKLFLGGPWGCPGTFPEPPGSRSGHFWRHGEDFGRIWSVPGTSQSTFGEPAGSSQDPKIDKKRTYGQKDGLGGHHRKRFSQILYADTVLDRFLYKKTLIFDDFWIRSVIARNVNQESCISFSHRWQTLKIIVISR